MGLEVQIYDGANPTNLLAILDGAKNVSWTDLFNDIGAGTVDLSLYDLKAVPALTQKGNLVKICMAYPSSLATGKVPDAPVPVYSFFNNAPKLVSAEAESAIWTFAGPESLSYMTKAGVYPLGWAGAGVYPTTRSFGSTASPTTWGAILVTLIAEAKARGAIPGLLPLDFTGVLDSSGAAWTANIVLTIGNLGRTKIYDIIKKFVSLGMDVNMDPNLGLHCFVTMGQNLTSTVIFRYGINIENGSGVENIGSMPTTVSLVEGTGGKFVETTDAALVASGYYGRLEDGLDYSQVTGDTTQMTAAGNAQIAGTELSAQAITVPLLHGATVDGQYEPYRDYNPGDTIALDVPGSYTASPFQIAGLMVQQDDANEYAPSVSLGAVVISGEEGLALAIRQMLTSANGTSSSIGASLAGFLTQGNPRGFPSGPSFPGNPAAGFSFFRTDLGEWCYYDGTRWLGPRQSIGVSMDDSPVQPYTATTASYGQLSHVVANWWVESVQYDTYVAGTNNGTNYWVMGGVNTSADAGSVWVSHPQAFNSVFAAGNQLIQITKVLSPGSLYVLVTIIARPIYT